MGNPGTNNLNYAIHLQKSQKRWKRALGVQKPYMRSIKNLKLGKSLDVGCGIGRVLEWLPEGSVGVDHNSISIELCKRKGLLAYESTDFDKAVNRKEIEFGTFDSIVMTHLLEHLTTEGQRIILGKYIPFLKHGGRIFIVTPQELGFSSDLTHITFTDFDDVRELLEANGLTLVSQQSFPLPRFFGRLFKYNEFHSLGILSK
jgi:2-polyprenyl-3-methyl-5-hydroxy-6-metoxy-1,4-benzoquinol methylase